MAIRISLEKCLIHQMKDDTMNKQCEYVNYGHQKSKET
jgi:hypothetical protein